MVHKRLATIVSLAVASCSGGRMSVDAPTESPIDSLASSCNIFLQIGCNEGYKCTLIDGERACTIDGTIPLGNVCNSDDDQCTHGGLCIEGTCLAFCEPNAGPSAGCQHGLCVPSSTFTCSIECNPLAPACSSPAECYLPLVKGTDTPGCLLPGALPIGSTCSYPNDCASGLTCAGDTIDTLGYASCRRRCLVASNDCTGGELCSERTVGDGYGVCLPASL